ncbi:MAG TPA: hypothetical protein VN654_22065 [Vicinamibacterales bacterium]|jgi:hypothetical protein|nr:hypothetical protein [Vicinamibacterales bacterium]
MYPKSLVAAALLLSMSAPAVAQEYVEYVSKDDRFTITFPAQPKVTQSTFMSQYGYALPSRVYSADSGKSRFVVTVVDYNGVQALGEARAKACPPGAEPCFGNPSPVSSTGAGYWKAEISGATTYATYLFLQRDAKLTFLGWATMDLVEGTIVSLTNNADKSRTSAGIYMHENKLYLFEATVPAGYPPPDFFQQSVGWIDENGNPIRYLAVYHNGFSKPPVSRRGGAAQ